MAIRPRGTVAQAANKIAKLCARQECKHMFEEIYQHAMFEGWPAHTTTGETVTHVWRLLDEENNTDMDPTPTDPYNVYSKLRNSQESRKVNFQEKDMKMSAAWHVSKASDYKFTRAPKEDKSERPFLSWSVDFDDNKRFEARKQAKVGRQPGYEPPTFKRVKLDLVALWNDKLFTEDSFADLSTNDTFEEYFKSVRPDLLEAPKRPRLQYERIQSGVDRAFGNPIRPSWRLVD